MRAAWIMRAAWACWMRCISNYKEKRALDARFIDPFKCGTREATINGHRSGVHQTCVAQNTTLMLINAPERHPGGSERLLRELLILLYVHQLQFAEMSRTWITYDTRTENAPCRC